MSYHDEDKYQCRKCGRYATSELYGEQCAFCSRDDERRKWGGSFHEKIDWRREIEKHFGRK